jgi:hypothetical protein
MDATSRKSLGRLQQVELRKFWTDEARDFTPWLAQEENLDLLSVTLGMDLELEGIEVLVGPYRADILARDIVSGSKVIIENQLDKTNHDHLGKTLTYASGLDARVVIWIAKEFSEEHRRAVDFLNENAAPNLRFYALEIQLWRIADSQPAPLFKVIASPNEYASIAKAEDEELSEAKALYLQFWTEFKEFCRAKGSTLVLRKPRPQHWFSTGIGRSGFELDTSISLQKRRIGCEIYIRGRNAKTAFKLLEKERTAIEQITGPLVWQELPAGQDCRIVLYQSDVNVADNTTWPQAFAWLKNKAELFRQAFAVRIKALPILDAASNGDSDLTELRVEYFENK